MKAEFQPLPADDLRRLYLEQTTKLAELTAALGLAGDEPTADLVAAARRLRAEHAELFAAAGIAVFSAQRSLGHVYLSPAALDALEAAALAAASAPSTPPPSAPPPPAHDRRPRMKSGNSEKTKSQNLE